jgi:hypothetical protein
VGIAAAVSLVALRPLATAAIPMIAIPMIAGAMVATVATFAQRCARVGADGNRKTKRHHCSEPRQGHSLVGHPFPPSRQACTTVF